MKKFLPILLLAFVSLFIYSCDNDDNVVADGNTYSKMRDVNVTLNSSNNYGYVEPLSINSTDVVLVYRRDVAQNNGWQLIPKTYYLSGGRELDYNFLFNSQQVEIYVDGIDPSTLSSAEAGTYLNNQIFRIVLVPASAGKNTNTVDTNDYNAVIKYYGLDDSKVPVTKAN
ncbi:hypothetical protein ACM39_09460 [Chryseobacterium sp. FH2]|uniref:hypothetical protein n=1 Tax=Chryseobacterium sp. FH2 TaxID=1674291 RepID=UPI00065ACD03|nr:hypothetical protein [Chryseobacterium sp. FH2]KMQ68076.1 hypothetical protein ACM39_09460 [Chryseobacterium sp. FH2]